MGSMAGKLRVAPQRRLALTPQVRRALDLLRMDAAALARLLEDEAAANPWLVLTWPRAVGGDMPDVPAPGPGLQAHVQGWIVAQFPPGQDRDLALELAGALEPTGWLGDPPEHIAARLGLPVGRVQEVLTTVQRIEPAGLFARDLADCLRLQAQAAGWLDAAMRALLARLDLLAQSGAEAVARAAGLPRDTVAVAVARLRGFDPKPGLAFDAGHPAPSRTPVADVLAERRADGTWRAVLNPAALPHAALRAGAGLDDAAARAAADLVALLDRRNRTLINIVDAVLAVQGTALERGACAMRPLTRAAIGEATGLAASTVGRALHGVRMATPQGMVEMAVFFPAALGPVGSAAQAQAALRALIAAENRAAPLSDTRLATALVAQGIEVSRRTVAKYRDRLGLPAAHLRKQPVGH